MRALAEGISQRAGAADDRRDVRYRCNPVRNFRASQPRVAFLSQTLFRERNEFDHSLISLARVFAEREYAVLVEDQPFDSRIFLEHIGSFFRKAEARHDVRHKSEAIAEGFRAQHIAFGLVDHAKDRSRVCMVDKFVRNEGVKERLHRWIWRMRIDESRALHANHFLVGHGGTRAELAQCIKPYGRHSSWLDAGHVPAGALDAEDIDLVVQQVLGPHLHRGVAASMQNQLGLAAEQAGRIDP